MERTTQCNGVFASFLTDPRISAGNIPLAPRETGGGLGLGAYDQGAKFITKYGNNWRQRSLIDMCRLDTL